MSVGMDNKLCAKHSPASNVALDNETHKIYIYTDFTIT